MSGTKIQKFRLREQIARDVDVSPRIETMFSDVHNKLSIGSSASGFGPRNPALNRKSFSDAEPPLTETRLMIVEAEKLGVKDDGLGDLSVLVDGFLQLMSFSTATVLHGRWQAAGGGAPTVGQRPPATSTSETAPRVRPSRRQWIRFARRPLADRGEGWPSRLLHRRRKCFSP